MAEAFLTHRLNRLRIPASVGSAGLLPGGYPPPAEGVEVMAGRGIDTSGHRSRTLEPKLIEAADLVLGMGREHVRTVVTIDPEAWGRSFTLKEVVRRGEAAGPRSEDLEVWLARVGADRDPANLVGASLHDDVADPIGQDLDAWEQVAAELEALVDRLVDLVWPPRWRGER